MKHLDNHSLQKRKNLTNLLVKKYEAEKSLAYEGYQKTLRYWQFKNNELSSLLSKLDGLQHEMTDHSQKGFFDAAFYQIAMNLMQDFTQQIDIVRQHLSELDEKMKIQRKTLETLDARSRFYSKYNNDLEKIIGNIAVKKEFQQSMEQYLSNHLIRSY